MFCCEEECIGCNDLEEIRASNDTLNERVRERVNETQELVMLNNFARENNECHFRKSLQQRISDIASWRWVLEDLVKRLEEATCSLKYEHNALRVVGKRLEDEIRQFSKDGSRPGALAPKSDAVEQCIYQELHFLRNEKKKFEKLILELEAHVHSLQKTKKRIETDIVQKKQALSVEESCGNIKIESCGNIQHRNRKMKRGSPVSRWENRCSFLKRSGLRALSSSIIAKQQVRGARVHLSIVAQSYGARVDSALRRRLYKNKIKLQDLIWQKEEAIRDYKALQEVLEATEKNFIETMEQERLVEARRSDRFLRPARELTKDEVDRNLRDELGRLRCFSKQLKAHLERITSLQNHLTTSLTRIDCYADDLIQIISLDEERIMARGGEIPACTCTSAPIISKTQRHVSETLSSGLSAIKEEEEDDYPFK